MWHACDSHVTHMWLLKKFQPQTIYRHSRNKWSVLVWLWKRNKREASQYANEWKNCRGTHNSFQLPVVVQKCTQFWCQSHLSLQVSCSCMAVKLFLQIANSVNRKCTQAHTLLTKGDFYGVCTQCARTHGVQGSTAWVYPYLFDSRKSFLGEGVLMAFLRAVCLGQ